MIGRIFFSTLILMLLTSGALAQGVPIGNGIYACDGVAQAGPCQPDDTGDTDTPGAPVTRWEDRWGAIATDGNGHAGIVTDMVSKGTARKAAIAECKRRGGGRCEIGLTYYNQCAAVATNAKASFMQGASHEEEAKQIAMDRCSKTGEQCQIYYSGCSLPVRVQ